MKIKITLTIDVDIKKYMEDYDVDKPQAIADIKELVCVAGTHELTVNGYINAYDPEQIKSK